MAVPLIGFGLSLVLSAAASFVAAALTRPKNPSFIKDDQPTALTIRGTPLPTLIGYRRIAPIFAWAGDRTVKRQKVGGGSNPFGGSAGESVTYYESGWHILCAGPGAELRQITQGGTSIWSGLITPLTAPSGTQITTDNGNGSFIIYWGECNQPINEFLASGDRQPPLAPTGGVRSRWPFVMSILWIQKPLGSSATWQNLQYDIVVKPLPSVLTGSDPWLEEIVTGDNRFGANPAHVLWQLLTAPAPHGLGIPAERLDLGAFEQLGVLMEAEHLPCHILATDTTSAVDLVAAMLADWSVALPQVGNVIVPFAIRPVTSTPPTVDDDSLAAGEPPRVQVHDAGLADRLVFTITDVTNGFRDMDIQIDDDSQAFLRNRAQPRQIQMPTVIDRATAQLVAQRRTMELLTDPVKYTLKVTRGARQLRPGQPFILDGYGQMRVASIERSLPAPEASIEAVLDQYAGDVGDYMPANVNEDFDQTVTFNPDPDLFVSPQELPEQISSAPAFSVARVRSNPQIVGANVYVSADGSTYTLIGSQDGWAMGGTLIDALSAATDEIIENGPTFDTMNTDILDALDLSGDDAGWRNGRQLLLIGSEIFFLRNVTALGGTVWQLNGLIRARFDTTQASYAIGTKIAIIARAQLEKLTTPLLQSQSTLYIKTQPYTATSAADLSTVTAVTLTTTALKAYRPLPPDNFRANDGATVNNYSTGGDTIFDWTYRVEDGGGRAAGEQLAGVAIGAGTPAADGSFNLRIYSSTNVLKRTINAAGPTVTYTNAMLITDFGAEPATFNATLTCVNNSYESDARSVTVTKV